MTDPMGAVVKKTSFLISDTNFPSSRELNSWPTFQKKIIFTSRNSITNLTDSFNFRAENKFSGQLTGFI